MTDGMAAVFAPLAGEVRVPGDAMTVTHGHAEELTVTCTRCHVMSLAGRFYIHGGRPEEEQRADVIAVFARQSGWLVGLGERICLGCQGHGLVTA